MAKRKSKKTAMRIARLKVGGWGNKTLGAAELHGKREDATSKSRRVSDKKPLLVGGLDLEDLYAQHTVGTKMDKRIKAPVMHLIFQWPKAMEINEPNQAIMLAVAREFSDRVLGGNAVFAGRLDRDEKGEHCVDIFATPIVTKMSAKGVESRWIQTSTHLKALTEKHREEIVRRHPTIKDITNPRCQGIAIQSEWINHLRDLGYEIEAKTEKTHGKPDRLSPEDYASVQEAEAKLAMVKAKIAKLSAVAARVPTFTAEDLMPAVLKKSFWGDTIETPELKAARVNALLAKASAPLVARAQRVTLAEAEATDAKERLRAAEADVGLYRELTDGLSPSDLLQMAQMANAQRAENKRLAAEQALVDEAQRRADALPGLLKKAGGAALIFVQHALAAIKRFGGHLAVDWKTTGNEAVRESTREHGHSYESAFKAVFDLSPGHVDVPAGKRAADLERAREHDAKVSLRPARPTTDSDYRPS